jgi:hypothetical protein
MLAETDPARARTAQRGEGEQCPGRFRHHGAVAPVFSVRFAPNRASRL